MLPDAKSPARAVLIELFRLRQPLTQRSAIAGEAYDGSKFQSVMDRHHTIELSTSAASSKSRQAGTTSERLSALNPDASPLKARKQSADNLFTLAEETELIFEEIEDRPSLGAQLLNNIQEFLKANSTETTMSVLRSAKPSRPSQNTATKSPDSLPPNREPRLTCSIRCNK